MCGRQGQAAAPSPSTCEGCHRHEVQDIPVSDEKPAPPKGTLLTSQSENLSDVLCFFFYELVEKC